jgi:hypothetical protein
MDSYEGKALIKYIIIFLLLPVLSWAGDTAYIVRDLGMNWSNNNADDAALNETADTFTTATTTLYVGNDGTDDWNHYIRFNNITIFQGAEIAYCSLYAIYYAGSGTVPMRVYCEDTNNATVFSTKTDLAARLKTNAYLDLNAPANADSVYCRMGDFKAPVQEVINRGGWQSGNSISFFIEDNNSSDGAYRIAYPRETHNAWSDANHNKFWQYQLKIGYITNYIILRPDIDGGNGDTSFVKFPADSTYWYSLVDETVADSTITYFWTDGDSIEYGDPLKDENTFKSSLWNTVPDYITKVVLKFNYLCADYMAATSEINGWMELGSDSAKRMCIAADSTKPLQPEQNEGYWVTIQQEWIQKPVWSSTSPLYLTDTGGVWATADLENLKWGVQGDCLGGLLGETHWIKCSQVYLQVEYNKVITTVDNVKVIGGVKIR